jgi:hypothetical protein
VCPVEECLHAEEKVMSLFQDHIQRAALSLCLAVGIGTATVNAGLIDPGLEIDWWVDGVYAGKLQPAGTYNEITGWWNYQGAVNDPFSGVSLTFNLDGDPDPLISGNLVVQNLLLPSVDITLLIMLPIAPVITVNTELIGSASLGLTTDSGGGSLSTFGGNPLWQGMIDGSPVGLGASMFFDPFLLSNDGLGSAGSSANFGSPLPEIGPPALNSIGIEINFTLTQLDQASITSVFHVVGVPAPGVIGLLGLAALGIGRRRR